MSVSGESYKFRKTSQNNVLVEKTSVGFYHTTSFHPEIFLDISQYVLFLEEFDWAAIETQRYRKCLVVA